MNDLNLKPKARVQFLGDRYWWTVRAADDRYVVLTRFTPFNEKGTLTYTIVDAVAGHRGPCNLIGQGWDIDPEKPEEGSEELLVALHGGRDTLDDESLPDDERVHIPRVEISHRNRVRTVITAWSPE